MVDEMETLSCTTEITFNRNQFVKRFSRIIKTIEISYFRLSEHTTRLLPLYPLKKKFLELEWTLNKPVNLFKDQEWADISERSDKMVSLFGEAELFDLFLYLWQYFRRKAVFRLPYFLAT